MVDLIEEMDGQGKFQIERKKHLSLKNIARQIKSSQNEKNPLPPADYAFFCMY